MKKIIYLGIFLLIILLSVGCTTKNLWVSKKCIGDGNSYVGGVDINPICCSGLKDIDQKGRYDANGDLNFGTGRICTSKCGNGICDTETEDPYNCSVDCH